MWLSFTVLLLVVLYGCTTWTQAKRLKKKLDGIYTSLLYAVLNRSWRQHSTKPQLYGHLLPISQTIQVGQARHCWRCKEELISNILLWIITYEHTNVDLLAKTYIHLLCTDTEYCLENFSRAIAIETDCGRKSRETVLSSRFEYDDDTSQTTVFIRFNLCTLSFSVCQKRSKRCP